MKEVSWLRLEPKIRNSSMKQLLEARLYDPLWTLGRQWQLGEFEGENRGSPVKVEVEGDSKKLFVGKGEDIEFKPLEMCVEREPILSNSMPLLRSVQIGNYFLDILRGHGLEGLCQKVVNKFPVVMNRKDMIDPKTKALHNVLNGKAIDGGKLLAYLKGEGDITGVKNDIIEEWVKWCSDLFSEGEDKGFWKDERLEYEFSLSDGEMKCSADEYYSGSLDWYSFDQEKDNSGEISNQAVTPMDGGMMPSHLEFSGMPKLRYWELEDEGVNFSAVSAEKNELLRMIFVDFTMVYGNDWFTLPLKLDVGTVNRIKSIKVTDTFGETQKIEQKQPASDWFELSNDSGEVESRGLFLAPVLPQGIESKPIERVEFIKDEMANIVWAIEEIIEGPTGFGFDRSSVEAMNRDASAEERVADNPAYRLTSKVPDHWIPFLLKTDGERKLRPSGAAPKGVLLAPVTEINEEEVIREGISVTRSNQYVRWSDGSTHVWTGRKKKTGRGERSSGLQYDYITMKKEKDS